MVEISSKSIENKCTHCVIQLKKGKNGHSKGNIKHVKNWLQAISSNFSCLFRSKIAKLTKDNCSHCAMDLDYCL